MAVQMVNNASSFSQSSLQSVPWQVCSLSCTVHISQELNSSIIAAIPEGTKVYEDIIQDSAGLEWLPINYEEIQGYALRCFFHRIHPDNLNSGNLLIGKEVVNRWWGVPLDYKPTDLEEIPHEWYYEPATHFLRQQAKEALLSLLAQAQKDGINLRICSAFRSGEKQRTVYLAALDKSGCTQRYSAPPGHSEHQLGTCVDFVDISGQHLFQHSYGTSPDGVWLHEHAGKFGFRRSYTDQNTRETGYISEPWHWRYWGH